MLTASCGFITQSEAGQSSSNTLTLSGTFPGGMTNQAYNAVLTVSGGSSPYQFVIKSGSLASGHDSEPGYRLGLRNSHRYGFVRFRGRSD